MFETYNSLSESNKFIAYDIAKQTTYSIEEISEMYFYFGRNFVKVIEHLKDLGLTIRYCPSMWELYSHYKWTIESNGLLKETY